MHTDEIWQIILESENWSELRFALMCRVSSDDQKKHGVSMEIQEQRLTALMNEMKVTHYTLFKRDEGKTATTTENRHDYNYIINNLDKYDVILCTKLDRWSRNPLDMLMCLKRLNTIFYTIDESYDYRKSNEWTMMMILLIISYAETLKTSERVQDIHLQRFKEGTLLSRPPLGFKIIKDGNNRKIIIDNELAKKILFAFKETLKGTSYKEICSTISYNTKKNNKNIIVNLSPQGYYNMIKNPIYKGYIKYNNELKELKDIPTIVPKDIWDKANSILKKHNS